MRYRFVYFEFTFWSLDAVRLLSSARGEHATQKSKGGTRNRRCGFYLAQQRWEIKAKSFKRQGGSVSEEDALLAGAGAVSWR